MKNKALFLDRDGVINIDGEYIFKSKDFIFTENIFEFVRQFYVKNYLIFVITNQSGISRGYFSEEAFLDLSEWMCDKFEKNGIKITKIYFDPTHINGKIAKYTYKSLNRKPLPGMIFKAQKEFALDLKASYMIGDKDADSLCAKNAGIGNVIRLDTGKYSLNETEGIQIVKSLKEILNIVNEEG